MAGIVKGRFIQLGQEGTAGSEANATAIYRGLATWTDETEVVFAEENVAYVSGVDRAYIPKVSALAEFEEHEATFEQINYWFDAGIDNVAGVADGAGTGYIYTYAMPELATDTMVVKTYTIEMGDNQQEEQAYGCFVEEFTISGAPDEALKISGNWRGRQLATGTKTAALSLSAVEEILFNKGKLYISTGDTFGSQVALQWVGFDLNVKTGWMYQPTGDGNIFASLLKQVGPEVTLDLTLEHSTQAVTEKAAWLAGTHRNVRMEFTGSTFATAGTAYSNKTFIIDVQGKWESFEGLDDMDGDDVVTGTIRARYNSTAQAFVDFIVVNALATIP
jgi:hypothetical protein